MNYDDITAIIYNSQSKYINCAKGDVIELYEELDYINVVDSAFPAGWGKSIRREYGITNIGSWGWAYTTDGQSLPVPCDLRSLTLFDVMLGTEFLGRYAYETRYTITYTTDDGEILRTGAKGVGESDAIKNFAKRGLGVVREIEISN